MVLLDFGDLVGVVFFYIEVLWLKFNFVWVYNNFVNVYELIGEFENVVMYFEEVLKNFQDKIDWVMMLYGYLLVLFVLGCFVEGWKV